MLQAVWGNFDIDLQLSPSQATLLVLIFAGTYFRGDRYDRISWVHIFADSPSKRCKKPQICLK